MHIEQRAVTGHHADTHTHTHPPTHPPTPTHTPTPPSPHTPTHPHTHRERSLSPPLCVASSASLTHGPAFPVSMGGEGALEPEDAIDGQVVGRLILCSFKHLANTYIQSFTNSYNDSGWSGDPASVHLHPHIASVASSNVYRYTCIRTLHP